MGPRCLCLQGPRRPVLDVRTREAAHPSVVASRLHDREGGVGGTESPIGCPNREAPGQRPARSLARRARDGRHGAEFGGVVESRTAKDHPSLNPSSQQNSLLGSRSLPPTARVLTELQARTRAEAPELKLWESCTLASSQSNRRAAGRSTMLSPATQVVGRGHETLAKRGTWALPSDHGPPPLAGTSWARSVPGGLAQGVCARRTRQPTTRRHPPCRVVLAIPERPCRRGTVIASSLGELLGRERLRLVWGISGAGKR